MMADVTLALPMQGSLQAHSRPRKVLKWIYRRSDPNPSCDPVNRPGVARASSLCSRRVGKRLISECSNDAAPMLTLNGASSGSCTADQRRRISSEPDFSWHPMLVLYHI